MRKNATVRKRERESKSFFSFLLTQASTSTLLFNLFNLFDLLLQNSSFFNDALILVVPDDFHAQPGAELEAAGLVLCHTIARGLQGAIWSLALSPDVSKSSPLPASSSSPSPPSPPSLLEPLRGVVAKISHTGALISEIEREWKVGRRLNTLAVEVEEVEVEVEVEEENKTQEARSSSHFHPSNKFPHGFATMGMAIRTASGAFRGFLMERVPGKTLAQIVEDPDFADARLLRSALAATFAALDSAQGALGFRHHDLRPPNVIIVFGQEGGGNVLGAKIIDFGLALFDDLHAAGPDEKVVVASSSSASSKEQVLARPPPKASPSPSPSPPPAPLTRPFFPFLRADASELDPPPATFFESVHRWAWRRRSDVYHLLLALTEELDERVWPCWDAAVVEALMSFVGHVTGVRPRAFFKEEVVEVVERGEAVEVKTETEAEEEERGAAVSTVTETTMTAADLFAYRSGLGRCGRRAHALRRWAVRARAWVTPRSPMITAAEALTAPLFTRRQNCRVRFV